MGLGTSQFHVRDSESHSIHAETSKWQLVGVDGLGNRLSPIPVGEVPVRIGRHPRGDVVLATPTVSKVHAEILAVGPTVLVRDLGSRNGTYVNDCRISSVTPVGRDDRIRVGDVVFSLLDTQFDTSDTAISVSATAISLDHWISGSFNELLTDGDLHVVFQPIVALDSLRTAGFEALIRCRVDGIESPTELFELASRLNMGRPLSHLCRVMAATEALRLPAAPPIFLNTSSDELLNADLIQSLCSVREMFPAVEVVVEINEGCITDAEGVVRFHSQLKELDYGLAFDDFGTGQSRIKDLTRILPDFVKFDQSVVGELHRGSAKERSLIQSLVTLFHDLGIHTIAECVECEECRETCRELGFEYCQGFITGAPARVEEWIPLAERYRDTNQEMSAHTF